MGSHTNGQPFFLFLDGGQRSLQAGLGKHPDLFCPPFFRMWKARRSSALCPWLCTRRIHQHALQGVPAWYYRGGTSKGLVVWLHDLPPAGQGQEGYFGVTYGSPFLPLSPPLVSFLFLSCQVLAVLCGPIFAGHFLCVCEKLQISRFVFDYVHLL